MKRIFLRISAFALAIILILSVFAGCSSDAGNKTDSSANSAETTTQSATNNDGDTPDAKDGDIVILYTNDVHCGVDESIGYAGLAAYKKMWESKTSHVTLVDCGDAVQGAAIGAVSKGEYPIEIMNAVGYDLAILGNHEFDYGTEQLSHLLDAANAQYLGCNINYTGEGKSAIESLKPYEIKTYGDIDVAYIGVTTPETVTSCAPSTFMDESGKYIYDFSIANGHEGFYTTVQENIDACKDAGADYVIVMGHMGDAPISSPYTSVDLISNTSGIDVFLDAHSHSTVEGKTVSDKDANEVILTSTGTKLSSIGQLIISGEGEISTSLVTNYDEKDASVTAVIEDIKSQYAGSLSAVVGKSDINMSIYGEDGIRLVRTRETGIGNFCADACRVATGADIAFVNGGGIRADIKAGDLTYGDILNVHPFGNTICMVNATGQEIADALELASRSTQAKTSEDGIACGESGEFMQVSGLRYVIDTSITSTVVLDENGMFVSCTESRRVTNIEVLENDGQYSPIDLEKTYTFATNDFIIKSGGGGFNMFSDNELIISDGLSDYQVLINYIANDLGGTIGERYATAEGRITVI